ncbi:MAG: site-specific DNA-methyltransferase [Candidatus Latescibacterota bacterium]|nr:site-specific DNA-methyltransferase [Candidatus Latescibacterota bacterium]
MQTNHRIVVGDARDMAKVTDGEVHLVITSPPYWQLKDYGSDLQLGFADSYEYYVNQLNLVWAECHRVMQPGCRLCVNVGDQFARAAYYGRYKIIPIRTEIIRFCESVGFDYMGAIIWQKVTTTNSSGGGAVMGSFPFPRNGVVKLDYEFILLFRKRGTAPRPEPERREQSRLTPEEWNQYFSGHWNFPGERQRRHLAAFPEELPRRLIRMFSFAGETVLDPFVGSGTTSVAAARLDRSSLGYEINTEYAEISAARLREQSVRPEIEEQAHEPDFEAGLARLPYLFEDPVRIERHIDPRTRSYGSRIDRAGSGGGGEQELLRVKQVLAPDSVQLDSGDRVKLLGVRTEKSNLREAMECLRELAAGKTVYLRYDDNCPREGDQPPRVYLYLRNKTPVNRHLIRSGLVAVDTARDYRFKQAFIEEWESAREAAG